MRARIHLPFCPSETLFKVRDSCDQAIKESEQKWYFGGAGGFISYSYLVRVACWRWPHLWLKWHRMTFSLLVFLVQVAQYRSEHRGNKRKEGAWPDNQVPGFGFGYWSPRGAGTTVRMARLGLLHGVIFDIGRRSLRIESPERFPMSNGVDPRLSPLGYALWVSVQRSQWLKAL